MSFDTDESSVQDGEPVEVYAFEVGATTYYLTSYVEDVTVAAQVYTSAPVSRGNVAPPTVGHGGREMVITVDRSSALALDIVGRDALPQMIRVTITRLQTLSAATRRIWRGEVQGYSTEGPFLRLRVPNATDEAFALHLPVAVVSQSCNHALYDAGCLVDRDYPTFDNYEFMSAAVIDSVAGTSIVVTAALVDDVAAARPDQWARYGEVRRLVDGERRSVVSQSGTGITIDTPFADLDPGDSLEVYKGCDHNVETCRDEFANVQRFGGNPFPPRTNPAHWWGRGIRPLLGDD
jgi:hypothetical protein